LGGLVRCVLDDEPRHNAVLLSISTRRADFHRTRIRVLVSDSVQQVPITGSGERPDIEFQPCGDELLAQIRVPKSVLQAPYEGLSPDLAQRAFRFAFLERPGPTTES
jgi:hypothetical protein